MGGRTGIPDSSVEYRAKLYGIEWSELHQEKFDACVNAALEYDASRYEAQKNG